MKKKLRWNPILKKDLMVNSRSMKMSWGIFGFNLLLAVIILFGMYFLESSARYGNYDYAGLVVFFPILGCVEIGFLSLLIPIITSGSISGERERQTLDIMLTTPIRPFSIALGKLGSALVLVMMYMCSSIPVLSISFILGGLSIHSLLGLLFIMLYVGIYVGSVGIFCSSLVKKSISATVLTILIGLGIILATGAVFGAVVSIRSLHIDNYILSTEPLILMLNPYAPVFEFMLKSTTSMDVYQMVEATRSSKQLSTGLTFMYKNWLWISGALNLLVSYIFLKLAATKISATKNTRRKKKKK